MNIIHFLNDTYKGSLVKAILLFICAMFWLSFVIWFMFVFAIQNGEIAQIIAIVLELLSVPILIGFIAFADLYFGEYKIWRDIHRGKDYRL